MKKFVSAVFAVIILSSCGKKDVLAPEQEQQAAANAKFYYKDANVAITDVKGIASGDNLKFEFTSHYEKNVAKVELMSGPYENMLCFFYEETIPAASASRKNYSVIEKNANTGTRFYVIKYTLKSGGWILTPPFRYQK